MVNYKPQVAVNSINIAGFVHQWHKNDKLIRLTWGPNSSNATWTINPIEGADYKVPAGRRLRIFQLLTGVAPSSSQHIISSTALDSNDNTVILINYAIINTFADGDLLGAIPVEENLYVNFASSDSTTHSIDLFAYEEDNTQPL